MAAHSLMSSSRRSPTPAMIPIFLVASTELKYSSTPLYPDGWAILNAEDDQCLRIANELSCNVAYFAMDENSHKRQQFSLL